MQTNLQTKINLTEEFTKAKAFITEHKSFLLATHARTDGDDLGAMLAFAILLKNLNKQAVPVALGGVPTTLRFLPQQNSVMEDLPDDFDMSQFDGIILFGCCDTKRTGLNQIINSTLPILNNDHHHDNSFFGQINMVDQTKSSVAEMIYDFFKTENYPITPDIAKCLMTGMFTDTGSFMHANTQASTLSAAADLMKHGARVDKIYNFTFNNKDLNSLKAWGRALENTKLDKKNRAAICVLTEEDLADIEPLNEDTFLGFADTLNTIPGIKYSLFIRQEGDYIKGSIRSDESKNVDVFQIAKMFGGGGHKLASGFKLKGKIIKQPNGSWQVQPIK